jgi:hypothetical protein
LKREDVNRSTAQTLKRKVLMRRQRRGRHSSEGGKRCASLAADVRYGIEEEVWTNNWWWWTGGGLLAGWRQVLTLAPGGIQGIQGCYWPMGTSVTGGEMKLEAVEGLDNVTGSAGQL